MMKKRLFREEQLERITSPERLDRYIRVADPGAWIVLAALLFLAAGVLVWGFTGTISKTIEIQAIVMNLEEDVYKRQVPGRESSGRGRRQAGFQR